MRTVEQIVSETLGIPAASVHDDLAYDSIPEWSSVAHLDLILTLEGEYDISIDDDAILELTSVGAIRGYLARVGAAAKPAS